MRPHVILAAAALAFAGLLSAAGAADVQRLIYVTSPDAAMGEGARGLYVFDIDDGHRLLKRIDVPEMSGGTRGCCGSLGGGRLFISHSNSDLLCFDVAGEKVLWNRHFGREEGGADRCCATPDGKKVYVPEGWWSGSLKALKVLDGDTGRTIKTIPLDPDLDRGESQIGNGHNSFMSPSGKRMYIGSTTCGWMFVIDTATDEIIHTVGQFAVPQAGPYVPPEPDAPRKDGGRVSPFCINGTETRCYVNTARVGFFVGDVPSGRILHWQEVEDAHGFSHGVGITPDEQEIWLWGPERGPHVDAEGRRTNRTGCLYLYDATAMPPRHLRDIRLRSMTHGWITFSLDGRYAYPDTLEVIDTKTKEVVAQLSDENGKPLASSKFVEVHRKGGKVVAMGEQFGNGYVGEPYYLDSSAR
jgi:hypothetical protein